MCGSECAYVANTIGSFTLGTPRPYYIKLRMGRIYLVPCLHVYTRHRLSGRLALTGYLQNMAALILRARARGKRKDSRAPATLARVSATVDVSR